MAVMLGNIAARRAENDTVENFAEKMVDEHSQILDKLEEIAKEEGLEFPGRLSGFQEETVNRLSRLGGKRFDRAYVRLMVWHHERAISEYRNQAQFGDDTLLKSFASTAIDTLELHLRQARDIEGALMRSRN